jgi:hypothetical protein
MASPDSHAERCFLTTVEAGDSGAGLDSRVNAAEAIHAEGEKEPKKANR